MNPTEKSAPFVPSASEYILDNFEPTDRIAMLVLNRDFGETIQRITSAQKAASLEFQAWLRYKNANGSDIYIGMNPLKKDASTRTKEDIASIRHVYIDLDHGAPETLEVVENSSVVPKPNYVVNSSPEKHQVVWKVEGMNLDEAETLLHALAHEFGGDPAATDAAGDREQNAFREQLANQPGPAGAQRATHRELACPRCRTRQREVGDIHASDQQHKADRREQHQEKNPQVANHRLLEGHQGRADALVGVGESRRQVSRDPVHVGARLLDRDAGL